MKKVKPLNMQLPCTREQLDYIQKYITPDRRVEILLAEADKISGAVYERLTEGMNEKNAQAFILMPMFIGGDSSDIETFVETIWCKPVTDENHKQVAEEFRKWYAIINPTEYHDPQPTLSLWEMGYRGREKS